MQLETGSYWRKWDLHIHTRSSYDYQISVGEYSDELLVQKWVELEFAAVAITDHFVIDKERIKKLQALCKQHDITLFPGVELRTHQGANNIHIIGIFPEDSNIDDLCGVFEYDFMKKAHNKESNETIYWNTDDIEEFIKTNNGIITVHAGNKASGIDKNMNNDEFYTGIKKEYAKFIDIFEVNNENSYKKYKSTVIKFLKKESDKSYPVIISSDNHNYTDYELSSYLWIKADPNFKGLMQALLHPEERIFVGNKPPKLISLESNPKVIIESIEINMKSSSTDIPDWFNQKIPLNPSLVAIIGNKGSGKSAMTDIIGTLTNSIQIENLSFLTKDRFNKSPHQYGKDFEAKLKWHDGKEEYVESLLLDNHSYSSHLSNAQYLPQTYIENTCSDLENKFFQNEINKVIFSYIPTEERLGSQSFEKFISKKTKPIQLDIEKLIADLKEINLKIINLEQKKCKTYYQEVIDKLAQKNSEHERHLNLKPSEILKPTDQDSLVHDAEIEEFRNQLTQIKVAIDKHKEELSEKSVYHQNLLNIQSKINKIGQDISHVNQEATQLLKLDSEKGLIKYSIPNEFYLERISTMAEEMSLNTVNIAKLQEKSQEINNKINDLTETTSLKNRQYQEYLNQLNNWENNLKIIVGNDDIIDSLTNLKKEKNYLDVNLDTEYNLSLNTRKEILKSIINKKEQISAIYDEIYYPIDQQLSLLLGDIKNDIKFQTKFVPDSKTLLMSLQSINKRPQSLFQGVTESEKALLTIIEDTEWNDFENIYSSLIKIIKCGIENDFDKLDKVINDKVSFYHSILSMEYLNIDFQLTYQNNDLSELSPGERGLVLLTFYLALSKDNVPIIIDQPEDNLDNQSVYSKLVPCILKAKQNRQVIIVTHNPNIAIACDAEQIIVANMDKSSKEIRYSSGSIENAKINSKIVEILEGTRPAFTLRESKYLSTIQ
ncbi:TrlF family AAA-like ATPase [Solibacillus sp. CAU 1738]|uniref:TrlF family AAA-like ATPase n=1 Tax=Solibacillus sp. CAU 1738 TaxID=3140363 RepID=UPI00325FE230